MDHVCNVAVTLFCGKGRYPNHSTKVSICHTVAILNRARWSNRLHVSHTWAESTLALYHVASVEVYRGDSPQLFVDVTALQRV